MKHKFYLVTFSLLVSCADAPENREYSFSTRATQATNGEANPEIIRDFPEAESPVPTTAVPQDSAPVNLDAEEPAPANSEAEEPAPVNSEAEDPASLSTGAEAPPATGANPAAPPPAAPESASEPKPVPAKPVARYNPCPAKGKVCVIMPLGDSITFGYNSANFGGYREPLFRRALQAGKKITFVGNEVTGPQKVENQNFPRNHEGHPGFTIEAGVKKGIAELVEASLEKNKPNVVTLMIGTNDVALRVDLDNAGVRLGRLLDRITKKSPNALIVLAKIVPSKSDAINARIRAYNARLDQLVKERVAKGKHIELVDMYSALTKDANFKTAHFGDGFHPNESGFELVASVWWNSLKDILP